MGGPTYLHHSGGTALAPHVGDKGVVSPARLAMKMGGSVRHIRKHLMRASTGVSRIRLDEALAMLAFQQVEAAIGDVPEATRVVVGCWPEIARGILQAAGRGPRRRGVGLSLVSDPGGHFAREADPRVQSTRAEPLDCGDMLRIVEALIPAGSLAAGLDALQARFGWHGIEMHRGGLYRRPARPRCFVEHGPGRDRVREVTADDANGDWSERSAWMLRYLLEPPPIDQWLHQAGLREFPRLRDLLWAMAKRRKLDAIVQIPATAHVVIGNTTDGAELETIARRL